MATYDHKKIIIVQFQKNSIPTPWKVGRGALKAKILEAKCEAKLEFPGGGGRRVQNKKPSMGGVWIFSGIAQLIMRTGLR